MKNTLQYISDKYKINTSKRKQPLEIPNVTREDLARLFYELDFTVGAEIGVEQGKYSEVLLKENPKLELSSVDPWAAYEGYRDHMTQEEMDVIYKKAVERLSPYSNRVTLIRDFSVGAADSFEDESLDFVYLDANHEFMEVVKDIAYWERKVRVGGIVAGHDYIKRKTNNFLMHVPYAIDAYVAAYQIKPLFILGRKEAKANLDPSKGEIRESTRSWFYVKPPRDPMRPGWSGWKQELGS